MAGEQDFNFIDVIIVIDSTGSMQRWINCAKNTLIDSFNDIRKEYPNSKIRLGLVCYRDILDEQRFIISPLTENIQIIQDIIKNVKATGGDDTAEDVAGALEKVIELLKKDSNENTLKIVLFVTDAPCHGLRYHSITVGDRYPNGDPEGKEPYEQIKELVSMNTDLTIFRINSSIDKMIEEFQNAFIGTRSTLTILDLETQDNNSSDSTVSLSSMSLLSGFIDLSEYTDEDYVSKSDISDKSDKSFREATFKSIFSSIERKFKK